MSTRVTNISDLVQRVTGSCLLHPLGSLPDSDTSGEDSDDLSSEGDHHRLEDEGGELVEANEEENKRREAESWERSKRELRSERLVLEMEALMSEVFDAVSGVKRAYVALQNAHNPWDPDRMRSADVSLVGQLRRLGVLRERYQKSVTCRGGGGSCAGGGGGGGFCGAGLGVREVVGEDLRREVKAREAEVESLKEKLRCIAGGGDGSRKKGRSLSNRKLAFGSSQGKSPKYAFFHLFGKLAKKKKKRAASFLSFFLLAF